MNLTTTDEFLYIKSKKTVENLFSYLKNGFDIIDQEAKEIPVEKEPDLHRYFDENNIEYQVICTTFISEIFHVIETYLKTILYEKGEYLIYPSIDKYPESKEKLVNYNVKLDKEISSFLHDLTKSIKNDKEDRIAHLTKQIGKILYAEQKDILVNSISCSEALYRIEKFLNWEISEEVKERFKSFTETRNEIVHFNNISNITFAISQGLFVLARFSVSYPKMFPKFSTVNQFLEPELGNFNILIQEILLNIDTYKKVIPKISGNGAMMLKAME